VGYEQYAYFCAVKAMHTLFRFYINSSIHLSLAVVCLVLISYYYQNLVPDLYLILFVFTGSICGYNFIKYFDVLKGKEKPIQNILKLILGFTLLCFLFAVYFFIQLSFLAQFSAFFCGILTFFYSYTFNPKGKNLRNLEGAKIFIIASVCSIVTFLLPLLQTNVKLGGFLIFLFLQRFVFILVVLLPFEIRDVKNDAITLGTIPQKIGVNKTKVLGGLLLVLFVLLSFRLYEGMWINISTDVSIAIIAALFLGFSKVTQQKYYASFWVEAIPIFWLVIWRLILMIF
jgi:hypothetical protein